MEMFNKLREPFPADRISWRVGSTNGDKTSGIALAYIDARDVMERLDSVVGPANWQCKYSHANGKTVCDIGLRIGNEWVWKADGAGDSDFEAEKGALSDAFKRAAVRWGIGRYLYDLGSPWVQIEARGKSFVIKDSEYAKLQRVAAGGKLAELSEKKPAPAQQARKAADAYIDRIAKAKTPEDADAVLAECEKGKLSAMFPELFAEVVEEHKAHIALLNRKGA